MRGSVRAVLTAIGLFAMLITPAAAEAPDLRVRLRAPRHVQVGEAFTVQASVRLQTDRPYGTLLGSLDWTGPAGTASGWRLDGPFSPGSGSMCDREGRGCTLVLGTMDPLARGRYGVATLTFTAWQSGAITVSFGDERRTIEAGTGRGRGAAIRSP